MLTYFINLDLFKTEVGGSLWWDIYNFNITNKLVKRKNVAENEVENRWIYVYLKCFITDS